MKEKLKKAIILIAALFLGGNLIFFIGLTKGRDIAISISRPLGANSWSTSNEFIIGCTYGPVILGASLMIVGIIFSTVIFANWIKKDN